MMDNLYVMRPFVDSNPLLDTGGLTDEDPSLDEGHTHLELLIG